MIQRGLAAASFEARWWPDVPRSPVLRAFRVTRVGLVVALGLLTLLPPHLLWLWIKAGAPSPFARAFHRLVCRSIGLDVVLAGAPFAPNALIVSNHISWADILVLGASTSTAFVAKSDVRDWPLLGLLARSNPTLFVERGARTSARTQVARLAEVLARGRVVLFPEGTTGDGTALLPFRPALFDAADDRPVQPVSIAYLPRARARWSPGDLAAFAWDGDKPFSPHFLAVIASGGARAFVTVHAPLGPGDRKSRAREAHAVIRAALFREPGE